VNHISVKNWSNFQHYKDRDPPWIKLHRALLDDYEFSKLPDSCKCHLMLIWLYAARNNGVVPEDAEFLADKIGANITVDIEMLVNSGFLSRVEVAAPAQPKPTAAELSGYGSRHISDVVKRAVWERDCGKCRACKSTEKLEYDHVIPVSKGGESSTYNLQLLCRSCSRKKRSSTSTTAEQNATHAQTNYENQRSPEAYKEEAYKEEAEKEVSQATPASRFDEFWAEYPRHENRKDAADVWKRRKLDAMADNIIADVKRRVAEHGQWLDGYIPHASTYLRKSRWEDDVTPRAGGGNGASQPIRRGAIHRAAEALQQAREVRHGAAGDRRELTAENVGEEARKLAHG